MLFENSYRGKKPVLTPRIGICAALLFISVMVKGQQATEDRLEEVKIFGKATPSYRVDTSSSATRTWTAIEEIPQSISIISTKLIRDQQTVSIGETLRNISGIVINNTMLTPAFDNTLIRGFSAEQYIDGFTQYYNPGDRDSLINVSRIEVLKGANGLLYGGGSGTPIGGIVNIVTKIPEAKPFSELAFTSGSNDFLQSGVDYNRGINDTLFARITGEYTRSKSDIDTLSFERYNINPSLRIQPTKTSDIIVRLRHSHWQGQDYQGLPAYGTVLGKLKIDPSLFIGHPDIEDSHSGFSAAEIKTEIEISPRWLWVTKMRLAESEFEENVQTISGGGFDFGADLPIIGPPALAQSFGLGQLPFSLYNARLYQEQSEISIVSNAISTLTLDNWRHSMLFGVDYSEYNDEGYINIGIVNRDFTVDLASPSFIYEFSPPGPDIIDNFVDNEVYGFYGQWQGSFKERLHLLLGLRYGGVKVDFRSPDNDDTTNQKRFIPRAGIVFDINPQLSAFAGFSKGMRGQAFADFVTTPEPEESQQGELGVKFKFSERLSGQLAYFKIERSNVGVPTPNPNRDGGFGVIAEGQQASRGIDTETLWQLNDAISIWGSVSFIDTRFEDDLFAQSNDGDQLPGVPKRSGRLWFNYEFLSGKLKGLRLGTGVYAQSETLISLRNDFYSDSFEVFDASIAYQRRRHRLELSIKNLSDSFYYDRLNFLGGRVAPGQQRALYLSWHYERK